MSDRRASLAFVAWLVASPTWADTYPRQPGVDAIHYLFRVALGDASNEIEGEAEVRVRITRDGVAELALDLATPAGSKGMTVETVASGGKPVAFVHRDDRLKLALPERVKAGDELSFTIVYRGVPADGLRLIPNIHGERTVFSENWPDKARQWLPMIDHPYDKATGELIVTAPAHYQVVSNGLLVEELDLPGGLRRTHWRQSVPVASWLYALGVARFAVHHAGLAQGVPLQSWVFPQERGKAEPLFEPATRRAIELFSERIGPYAYEKLANVQAAGMGGGTEHASAIFYGEKNVRDGRVPVVHEVAHQWWGNAVTEGDWDDVWLSEGFATYFTLLYAEHFEGRDAFVAGLKRSREQVLELEKKLPDTPVIHRNLSDMKRVLNQLVYQKGGWTLHMLRGQLGAPAFWSGIREYYRRYRDKNASTEDFRAVMEQSSAQDLGWFFEQWLRRSGVPRLEGRWRWDAAAKQVELTLTQAQAGEPFRLAVEIGLQANPQSPARVQKLELAARSGSYRLAAEQEPAAVLLDPGTWLLMEAGPFAREQGR
jgi:aminopeptidase N